jgi:hypothetical protein
MSKGYLTCDQLRAILDEKLAPLQTEMRDLKAFVEEANKKYDEVIIKLQNFEVSSRDIIAENKVLKTAIQDMNSRVNQLNDIGNDLEQYTRRECVEVQGIPQSKDENTDEIIPKVGDLMGLKLDKKDISVSHRLPVSKKYNGSRREPGIIVKFVRRNSKDSFYKARRELKKFTTKDLGYRAENPIYVNESLTGKNKNLFNECVKAKKNLKYDYIWTFNGRVFMRKDSDSPALHIKNINDINKLQVRASQL